MAHGIQSSSGGAMEAKMMFCGECDNLLYPVTDENRKMRWMCRACRRIETHDENPLVYTLSLKRELGGEAEFGLLAKFANDRTVGRTNAEPCPRCAEKNLAFFINPLEQPTEDMSLYLVCVSCKYVWRAKKV